MRTGRFGLLSICQQKEIRKSMVNNFVTISRKKLGTTLRNPGLVSHVASLSLDWCGYIYN
jgi:hypothetical protein